MRITSGGCVGIGTTTTYSTLTVGSGDGTAVISPGGTNTHLTLASLGAAGAIRFYTIGGGTGVLATTESMRIAVGGNVGIGTTSPSTLFYVNGYTPSNWITTLNNTGISGHQLYFGYNDGTTTQYGLYIAGGPGSGSANFDFAVGNKFRVYADGKA